MSGIEPGPVRRLGLVNIFFVACFGLVGFRLFDLQTRGYEQFERYARQRHFSRSEIVPAPRGSIYDRNGHLLAVSVLSYDLFAEPPHFEESPGEIAARLGEALGQPPEKYLASFTPGRRWASLERGLDPDQRAAVAQLGIKGTGFSENYYRFYPEGRTASHLLGFVEQASQAGLEGVEKFFDGILAGREGRLYRMRDGRGRTLASHYEGSAPRAGSDLYLTVDLAIQRIAEEELARLCERWAPVGASVVIMDPADGAVLALANRPDYNPNRPGEFPADSRRNRAIADLHEPGSVFKVVTAAALLEEGVVTPETEIHCEHGRYRVRNRELRDVHPYGLLTFREAMIKSSNIALVKAALDLGEEKMHLYAHRFGFGRRSGVELAGERAGILRPPERWSRTSLTAVPIGYEVSITALQSARALSAIVNGGFLPRPSVVLAGGGEAETGPGPRRRFLFRRRGAPETPDAEGPEAAAGESVISPATAETLVGILEGVTGEGGTARQGEISGYRVGGKTGTARKIVDRQYSRRYLSSFAGFVLNERQSLVIVIMVDQPRGAFYGGTVAAPTFRQIGRRTMLALDISPEPQAVMTASRGGT